MVILHRWHSDGWLGLVQEQADGTFAAGALPPSGGALAPYATLAAARDGADAEAARHGHVCDGDCEPWQEGPPET